MSQKPMIDITPHVERLPRPMPVTSLQVIPPAMPVPQTVWGAKRAAKYYRAATDLANAQTGLLNARTEVANAFVRATRAMNEVNELPDILAADTQVRELQRRRDHVRALRELEEERYGLLATQNETDKLRKPRVKKAAAALDALLKAKVDMEALGEDTTELDQTILSMQRAEP